jgi:hypothetical protein
MIYCKISFAHLSHLSLSDISSGSCSPFRRQYSRSGLKQPLCGFLTGYGPNLHSHPFPEFSSWWDSQLMHSTAHSATNSPPSASIALNTSNFNKVLAWCAA